MAQVKITVGSVDVQIEDEDESFGPLLKGARKALFDLIERIEIRDVDEEDED